MGVMSHVRAFSPDGVCVFSLEKFWRSEMNQNLFNVKREILREIQLYLAFYAYL